MDDFTCFSSLGNLKLPLGDVDGVTEALNDSGTSGSAAADDTLGVVGVEAVLLCSSGDSGSEEQLDNLARFLLIPGVPVRFLFNDRFIPFMFLLQSLLKGTSWLTGLTSSGLTSFCDCCLRFSFFSIFSICLRYASSFLSSLLFLPCFSGLFSISESLSP